MKNILTKLVILTLLNLFGSALFAQPEPCGSTPTMANNCADACVICDINGFTGTNDLQAGGQSLGNIFCSTPNDMHFIAFIAGSTSLSIQIDVSNCANGQFGFMSLDLGFYESLDCENFTPITECKEDLENGDAFVFNTTVPLVIGQHYYLIMDGSAGSICDWTFTVLDGTTEVNPLDESGDILGDSLVCVEDTHKYFVDFPVGAADFEWTLNGNSLNINSDSIEYTFTIPGTYELCVTSKNACDEALPTCRTLAVKAGNLTEIVDVFCANDCYLVGGDTICETGFYEFVLQNEFGCDSIITADLEQLITPILDVSANICDGDSLFIGTTPFTETGLYEVLLTSIFECDSVVNLDLFIIQCNIEGSDFPTPAVCFDTETGMIDFQVDNGTPPFTYSYENLNATHSGNGNITSLGETINISNIPRGTYIITIEDTFGNIGIIISEVTEPPLLSLDFVPSDYNGFNVSCATGSDGILMVTQMGGVPPYNYLWNEGQTTATIDNLSANTTYTVTITDASGCELVGATVLNAPDSLILLATFIDANCDALNTGIITVDGNTGGIFPFSYELEGMSNPDTTVFENLVAGEYTVIITDVNGCTGELTGSLGDVEIPIVDLGESNAVELGETFEWKPAINNISIQNLQWTSTELLSCDTCLNPEVTPMFSGSYELQVTSEDGCVRSDSTFLDIITVRKAYLPNVFSPNFDGINDNFTVFGDDIMTIDEADILTVEPVATVVGGKVTGE